MIITKGVLDVDYSSLCVSVSVSVSRAMRTNRAPSKGGRRPTADNAKAMEPSASPELKTMHRVVCGLLICNESKIFRMPVDYKGLGLIDYPKIVKKPKDLGTIKSDLEAGKYHTKEEVANDVRLVWTNCMLFNADSSEYYHLADRFARGFEETYKTLFVHAIMDENNDRVPSVDEKIALSYDVFKITAVELARVLTVLEEKAPDALKKNKSADEVLINFDAIPNKVFHEVQQFTTTCLANEVQSTSKSKKRKSEAI